ncbi:M23 family metallopeptidase [Notoacmeibacter ruber]|uniref:M23 family metallopeptidase n=1 Tax=Notoacmeibacter ruber TaxID=2670375 RepID=A0A3L7JBE1_9HYPH|nr:M23 family metallopeptidase [Notoacmeibacter ruber]RLQ87764.1 M23 family metallopeptidase [Notoacmeibacter ruber]
MGPSVVNPTFSFGQRQAEPGPNSNGRTHPPGGPKLAKRSLLAIGGLLFASYLSATAYLVMRDDLIVRQQAHDARMQHAYEDRISELRRQVDRITSRQMLDQHLVEKRMFELMARQDVLASRSAKLVPILRDFSVTTTGTVPPLPKSRPEEEAKVDITTPFAADGELRLSLAERADVAFVALQRSLHEMESQQIAQITHVTQKAEDASDRLQAALVEIGMASAAVGESTGTEAMGGPFEEVDDGASTDFNSVVERLDTALQRYDRIRGSAAAIPLAHPLPGHAVTSSFGIRRDPIIGRRAMHSGIDFKATSGTPIIAPADGVVVKAGRNGGYGRMVQIRHGNGLTTRYGHLSEIAVKTGQEVARGTVIGQVGSTGRSTGPHLHYEIRRRGAALNPDRFLKAGETVRSVL